MFKKTFFIFLLLFSTILSTKAEQSSKIDSTYFIDEIAVNRTDNDATIAREKAIFDGQRRAFNIVLDRIGIDRSNSILISNDEISRMLRSMQIKNEKVTTNSYSAILSMEFSPDFIKYTLNKYNIGKFTGKINSYLVIPVLKENNDLFLWGKGNRWISAFEKNLKNIKNIILISNDENSREAFNIKLINNPTFSKFKDLIKFYEVNNIVLVVGEYGKEDNMINSKIIVLNEDEIRNASLNYQIKNKNNVSNDFNEASLKIIAYLNKINEIKNESNSDTNVADSGFIKVFVSISSLNDLNDSENILKSDKNVIDIALKSLTKNVATYNVKIYNNDVDLFISSLKDNGFLVNQKDGNVYMFLNSK